MWRQQERLLFFWEGGLQSLNDELHPAIRRDREQRNNLTTASYDEGKDGGCGGVHLVAIDSP